MAPPPASAVVTSGIPVVVVTLGCWTVVPPLIIVDVLGVDCNCSPVPLVATLDPFLFPANQLTPSARSASRVVSRKLTLRSTCCEGATCIALMTPLGDKAFAIAIARSAWTASRASPVSTTCPSLDETRMPRLPVPARTFSCTSPTSGATSTSSTPRSRIEVSNTDTFVVPIFLPWM